MEWTQHTFLLVSARSKVGIFSIWEDTLNYFWSICKDWSVRERELGTKTGQGVWAGRDCCVQGEKQEMESDCKAGPLQYLAKQWWPDGEATRGTWILRRKIIWPGLHIWKTQSRIGGRGRTGDSFSMWVRVAGSWGRAILLGMKILDRLGVLIQDLTDMMKQIQWRWSEPVHSGMVCYVTEQEITDGYLEMLFSVWMEVCRYMKKWP